MRPLSKEIRAAYFFYLGFALLLLITSFISTRLIPVTSEMSDRDLGAEELMTSSNELLESWRAFINKWGYDVNACHQAEEIKLHTREVNQHKLEWISFTDKLTLPESDSEKKLIDLGNKWKKLTELKGFKLSDAKWGYSGNKLWLKLISDYRYDTQGKTIIFPIAAITLVQPLKKPLTGKLNWKGMLPETPPVILVKPAPPHPVLPPVVKPEAPLPKPAPSPQPKLPSFKRKARVSIIIDDVGFVKGPADKMLEVPARLTWSFLPFSPYEKEYEAAALKRGFEIMLHLPLEAFNPNENPGPGVIKRDWTEEEIIRRLDEDLSTIPSVRGINNHMGSAGTSDLRLMEILMREIKKRNLYFIDSYTANQSVAQSVAKKYQVPTARRDIFIDHYDSYEEKKKALRTLIKLALRNGEAIGIGHVRSGTAEAIMEVLPEFIQAGVEIVPVSELINK